VKVYASWKRFWKKKSRLLYRELVNVSVWMEYVKNIPCHIEQNLC
jgi:hypothetical protein